MYCKQISVNCHKIFTVNALNEFAQFQDTNAKKKIQSIVYILEHFYESCSAECADKV